MTQPPIPTAAGLPRVKAGQRIRVVEVLRDRRGERALAVEGVVESIEWKRTGSWFAHGKDDRLWLRRVLLRKDDGELALINLDREAQLTVLG